MSSEIVSYKTPAKVWGQYPMFLEWTSLAVNFAVIVVREMHAKPNGPGLRLSMPF